MSIIGIHYRMIKRNTWRDYFATLRFCFTFFEWKTALRLPVYVTPLVQYKKPKDKHRIVLDNTGSKTYPANLLIGYLDREYSWDRPSFLNIRGQLQIHGGATSHFAPGASLCIMDNAHVELGSRFTASHNLRIYSVRQVVVGNDNMWSYDCVVMDTDAHELSCAKGGGRTKRVQFGDHVWMGARNIVLKGTEIPDGAVLGAGQQLRKSYMDYKAPVIAGGDVVRENVNWSRKLVQ